MNVEQPRLLLGLTPLAEREVETLLFAADPEIQVVGSASDAGELLVLAERHDADAVLFSAELPGLSESHCARLRAQGLRLLGLALDDANAATLSALGADTLLTPPLQLGQLATATRESVAQHSTASASEPANAAAYAEQQRVEQPERSQQPRASQRAGSVIAVVGADSSGASECAASLAALAAQRWSTLLVELDLLGGSLDLRLGSDPHHGSLLGLVRAAADQQTVLGELLDRWTCGDKDGWPPVLLNPPDLDAHIEELDQPGAIRAALDAAASLYPLVVCDVGSLLTAPGELPRVARCHREALLAADAILLVTGAHEQQLRAGRNQLTLLLEGLAIKRERLRICVNGAGAPGAGQRRELEPLVTRDLGEMRLAVDAWLPYDRRALARAHRTGLPFVLARPRGPYTRAVRRLLDELLLPAQPVARERKQRLPVPSGPRRAQAEAPSRVEDEEVQLPWRS